ncbi:MAG: DEAD/DEAH box helicase [Thermoanaerobaculales bacterium]|jgi:ATP-dependent Lhr-like helicase|nr:DEAD/DEAH box helicase [Thermoanaerobaculales bacterium]
MTSSPDPSLRAFSAPIAEWFSRSIGTPTEIQTAAWPHIAAGDHVLLCAPTGSGKTFAAFLCAIDRLLTGAWETGGVRVLYVSPLKALGTDIRRNLTEPLTAISSELAGRGAEVPRVRVESRTGDTPADDRRRMLRSPPEILVTTPESLNILLASIGGRRLLSGLRCVILDEVHAVAGSKRGVHLITAVERLSELVGEIQRIALSATVRPREQIAAWVGGWAPADGTTDPEYRPRPVSVVVSKAIKAIDLEVVLPAARPSEDRREPDAFWTTLGAELRRTIAGNRSTLVFGNARRSVEKVARFINEAGPERIAYSHHGALSREIRTEVETRLKRGELRAIVATSSLELGIDIGAIDEVVLVQTPPSVVSTLQRVGRAGHRVGETSRARLMPLLGRDLLEAAVVARAAVDGEIEAIEPVTDALDVLAQVLLSMVVAGDRTADELYASIRRADPYHRLPRRHFDLVLEMLAGRYASSRIRSLRPMVSIDGVDGVVRARPGAARSLFLAGGTIPDRGYHRLRIEGSGAPLGELDEEFVWERSVGDTFTLGVQTWRVERITHNDVFVTPTPARSAMAPFWRAEELDRSSFVAERMAELLEAVDARLGEPELAAELRRSYRLDAAAAAELVRHLRAQREATGCLPHRHRVIVEHTSPPAGRGDYRQLVLHTLWGGRVNRPFAIALSAAWEARYGARPEIAHSADCVVLVHPATIDVGDPFELVAVERLDDLLRSGLERSGFFGARFREAAGRALLLPRAAPGKRVPLWVSRQRSKELLEAVRRHDDFPIVLEAWRTCLRDEFELDVLRRRLDEVADGRAVVRHVATETPSPFSAQVAWKQTNQLMYEDDTPTVGSGARADLVREIALAEHLRPRIPAGLAAELGERLQRLAPGWSPRGPDELLEWLKERVLIPLDEWRALLEAIDRDHRAPASESAASVAHRVVIVGVGRDRAVVCPVEGLARVARALGRELTDRDLRPITGADPPAEAIEQARQRVVASETDDTDQPAGLGELASLLGEWLRFYPPVDPAWVGRCLGLEPPDLEMAIGELEAAQEVVVGELVEGVGGPQVCDRENLERLLRRARSEARPELEPVDARALPLLLAGHQGLGARDAAPEDLEQALERLFGLPLPVELWETEIFPARLDPYHPEWLDGLLGTSDLRWVGAGNGKVMFALETELGALRIAPEAPDDGTPAAAILPYPAGRFTFDELVRGSGLDSGRLTRRLWRAAWAGEVSSDTFDALRSGLAAGFAASPPGSATVTRGRGRRAGLDRWRRDRPFTGAWFALPEIGDGDDDDILQRQDEALDRARVVLDRYGIVFRALLEREPSELRWSRLFRALRLLELAGEIVAGRFIEGVDGLQFASHEAVRRLREGLDEDLVWWVNAIDPASPCGLGLEGAPWDLPRRVPGNHLVFHGRRLVIVSVRRGAELTIAPPPDDPGLAGYLDFLAVRLGRRARPMSRIDIETINGEPAPASPYREVLARRFHVTRQPSSLRLARKY